MSMALRIPDFWFIKRKKKQTSISSGSQVSQVFNVICDVPFLSVRKKIENVILFIFHHVLISHWCQQDQRINCSLKEAEWWQLWDHLGIC